MLTLGGHNNKRPLHTMAELDAIESRAARAVGLTPVAYIPDTEAGGLTFKGCLSIFRKLPFMPSLRVLRLVGLRSATWAPYMHEDIMRALAAGVASLPSVQVRSWYVDEVFSWGAVFVQPRARSISRWRKSRMTLAHGQHCDQALNAPFPMR